MPIPLLVWAAVALGGLGGSFGIGALSRQPEINNLQNQVEQLQREVEKLQEEVKRLQRLVDEQNRQIQALTMKYHTMAGIHFIEKAKAKNKAKGAVMYTYCLMEYLELKHKELTKSYHYTDEEKVFVEAFSLVLEGRLGSSKEDIATKYFLRVYIRNLYAEKIDSLEECPLQNTFSRVGVSI